MRRLIGSRRSALLGILLSALSIPAGSVARAEERLVVHLKDGRQQSFPMEDVTHIEFTGRGSAEPSVVGTWSWVSGQTLVVAADHTLEVLDAQRARINDGKWELLDAGTRRYRFTHRQGGWVDTVVLSASGNELDGKNNRDVALHGSRAAAPVEPGPVGTWNWVSGQTLVVRADHSIEVLDVSGRKINDGTWEMLDAGARRFRFTHRSGGWVDTVVLNAAHNTLDGTNNQGHAVHGTRR